MEKEVVMVEKEFLNKLLTLAEANQQKLQAIEDTLSDVDELVARIAVKEGLV